MAYWDDAMGEGLTPKFKDVDAHLEMLTYEPGKPDIVGVEKDTDMDNTLYLAAAEEQVVKAMGMGKPSFKRENAVFLLSYTVQASFLGLRLRWSTHGRFFLLLFLPQQNLIL